MIVIVHKNICSFHNDKKYVLSEVKTNPGNS